MIDVIAFAGLFKEALGMSKNGLIRTSQLSASMRLTKNRLFEQQKAKGHKVEWLLVEKCTS
jgi:hypothetical protein